MCDEKCINDISLKLNQNLRMYDNDVERITYTKCDDKCKESAIKIKNNYSETITNIIDNLNNIKQTEKKINNLIYSPEQSIKKNNINRYNEFVKKKEFLEKEYNDLMNELEIRTELHLIQYDFNTKNDIIIKDLNKKILNTEKNIKKNKESNSKDINYIGMKQDESKEYEKKINLLTSINKILFIIFIIGLVIYAYKYYKKYKFKPK